MIIDCHGHFTTEPEHFHAFRRNQLARDDTAQAKAAAYRGIETDELESIIRANQLLLQKQRGTDVTILSPRASGMGHSVADAAIARAWSRQSNENVRKISELFPANFAAVCQLPQTPGGDLRDVLYELDRCAEAGFVGCNVNPDPSGGTWSGPPVGHEYWSPLWDRLEKLQMPAMLHVSGSCRASVHTTGAHYLAGDTIVFMQLLQSDLFERHPDLRVVIPHGGGAVPYHWGRFRGLAIGLNKPPLEEHLMRNVFFDTCVYHQAGVDLLLTVIDHENVLFGSELLGAVKQMDPETGHQFDDTRRYVDQSQLDANGRALVYETNARRVYPRLDALLTAQGR